VLEMFLKGGPLMYPLLLCSVAGCAIITSKFFQYRSIVRDIEKPLADLQKSRPAILQPLLADTAEGYTEKELAVIGTRQIREIEKGLSWLALITTIAPLLGLTGTVTGMIRAFLVIEKSQSVSPAVLAGGIWVALITTVAGLIIAILVHIGHHYLEKKADEIAFVIKEIVIAIGTGNSHGD